MAAANSADDHFQPPAFAKASQMKTCAGPEPATAEKAAVAPPGTATTCPGVVRTPERRSLATAHDALLA